MIDPTHTSNHSQNETLPSMTTRAPRFALFQRGRHPSRCRGLMAVFAVAVLIPIVGATSLEAQQIPSSYRFIEHRMAVDLQGGYHTANNGELNLGPKSGPMFGLQWNALINGPFAIELGGWYSPTTRDVVDLTREEGSQVLAEADVELITALANLRFALPGSRTWHGFHPYIVLGAGVIWDIAGRQPEDELILDSSRRYSFGSSLLARGGLGALFLVTDRLELRADAIFELWQVETPRGWLALESQLGPLPQDEWVNGFALTLGAGWRIF